ncbi:MAG: hypothetical protein IBX36_01090 [Dehalococcoidia bacterium]|nr:hypothetical protein [Dehalococcoidia bacterium]
MGKKHAEVVDMVKAYLLGKGHKELSPAAWIRGPVVVDILTRSDPPGYSHPMLTVIEVKVSGEKRGDHQRALYQLLVAKERLAVPRKYMRASFHVAISDQLYKELEKFEELEDFLKVMSGLVEGTGIDIDGTVKREQPTFGIGVLLVDESSGEVKPIRNAGAYMT